MFRPLGSRRRRVTSQNINAHDNCCGRRWILLISPLRLLHRQRALLTFHANGRFFTPGARLGGWRRRGRSHIRWCTEPVDTSLRVIYTQDCLCIYVCVVKCKCERVFFLFFVFNRVCVHQRHMASLSLNITQPV